MDNAALYNLAVSRLVSLFRRSLSMKNESLCLVSLNWKLESRPVVVYAPCEWFWRVIYLKLISSLCVSNMELQTLSYNNELTNAQYLYNWINRLPNTTIWWLDICCLLHRYQLHVSALMAIFRLIDWQQTCKLLYFGMRLVCGGGGLGLDGGTRSRVCWVGRVMWVHGYYCAGLRLGGRSTLRNELKKIHHN